MASTKGTLNRRLSKFMDWLRPEEHTREKIKNQAAEVRERICKAAQKDGLTIQATPNAGSFAKKTGLRRHMQGDADVEGLDVDLPFIIAPAGLRAADLGSLIHRFERYANDSYSKKEGDIAAAKTAVKITFKGTKLHYDLVPIVGTGDQERQLLFLPDGSSVETSVQKHKRFVRQRTKLSANQPGVVRFNDCVRFVKWWREFSWRQHEKAPPSFALTLLCAAAFDRHGVAPTYADTLAKWFGWMATTVQKRKPVMFADFKPPPAVAPGSGWQLIDPVNFNNATNNVAKHWSQSRIDTLARRLTKAHEHWQAAVRANREVDQGKTLKHLVELFGPPVKHHSKG